jgi:outer membrane receptor protein involved in Fe transport
MSVNEWQGRHGANGSIQLDAGVQFSLNSHIILTADGLNLRDSREFTYANVIQDTQTYRDVGRRYTVGIRAKY